MEIIRQSWNSAQLRANVCWITMSKTSKKVMSYLWAKYCFWKITQYTAHNITAPKPFVRTLLLYFLWNGMHSICWLASKNMYFRVTSSIEQILMYTTEKSPWQRQFSGRQQPLALENTTWTTKYVVVFKYWWHDVDAALEFDFRGDCKDGHGFPPDYFSINIAVV